MIYDYFKYKDIESFYDGIPVRSRKQAFTILHKCQGCGTDKIINDHCFGCLFCAINDMDMLDSIVQHFGYDFIRETAENAFKGSPVKANLPQRGIRHPYTSLEKFTAVDENANLQTWTTGLLHLKCTTENRISMEVPIFNTGYDRNGRLDICSITDQHMLVIESKTTVDDALADERFVEQHEKYTNVLDEITTDYTYLTLVGGRETDIYPLTSRYSTGSIGGKASRFLSILQATGIQVITANALWCLCCKFITEGDAFAWDTFLINFFSNPECIGLVSSGAITIANGEPVIEPIF